jgi:type IX secretion system PorP/SprF family membrane protein
MIDMKKQIERILFILMIVLLPKFSHAQADIHFSQFYETSILRNPSLVGVFEKDFKVGGNYRKQWESISNPFETTLAYAEFRKSVGRVANDFLSIGVLAYSDKAGTIDQKITSFYPALNFSKCLNPDKNTYLSVGFTAGYTQYSFDLSKASFNNQYMFGSYSRSNPTREHINNSTLTLWDLGTGINFNSTSGTNHSVSYMFGISGYHLTQPNFSYDAIPGVDINMRWNINGAVGFDLGEGKSSNAYLNVALQGAYREIVIGDLMTYSKEISGILDDYALSAGLFYRYGDALIPVLRMRYKNVAVGYSYDINVSRLTPASNMRGGSELTIFITGNLSNKNSGEHKTVCPKF